MNKFAITLSQVIFLIGLPEFPHHVAYLVVDKNQRVYIGSFQNLFSNSI
ncbi:hypothetical protein STSP2_01256 [Anaerohalosphaera lusitana]|uniref:Uncharacterized protein n=1 Tax=Anaerohalosphaera lusitana TaxID=1936003 RepID=A0A1U9NJK3_9BACT|nr:hypothetical protein STSP2_01256 [Anaerohalosphaera lusitana]